LAAPGQLNGIAVTIEVDGEVRVEMLTWLVVGADILVGSTRVSTTTGEDETIGELAGTEEDAATLLAMTTEPEETAEVSVTVVKAVMLLVSVTREITRIRNPTVMLYLKS
jgi:hypothetical protein